MKNSNKRKVIVYIAVSIDGYIAKKDGDISWLSIVEKEGEDYGYSDFIKTIDTVIMGRKTYDKVLSMVENFPHKDKKCYIITHTKKPHQDNLEFYTGDLKELVSNLKSEKGNNIFIDGGSEIINYLMKCNLIDEFVISILPILLGDGIKLFKEGNPDDLYELLNVNTFDTGLVQLHYKKK
ncbi:MAG: dihydrofolate reductase [Ignavibacteriae bacterium]|nr:dihydrofolate reductase [Ignavibacteriota bacterium]